MKPDAAQSLGTEQDRFNAIMNPASDGIEAAVRCYVAGDIPAMRRHLACVEAGVRLLREWASE